ERHPDFGFDLRRRRLGFRVADLRAFDAVPDDFLIVRPFSQSAHAIGDEPEFAGDFAFRVGGGIDVEGDDVAAFDIVGVIFVMIAAHAAADPVIPGDALAEIEQYGTRRVRFFDALIRFDDLGGGDGRTVTLAAGQFLGVVRLVAVHPADDGSVVLVLQSDGVL